LNVTCHPAEVTFSAALLGRIAMRIAYTRPVVTVIARSVFCWLVVSVGCAKTDEPIEVPSGLRILVGICDSNEINLMRDDNKRPDGTTLLPWARGKPIAWDVTVPDTYAESHIGNTATKPGAAARKTAQNKIDKYSKLASTHIFYPFAIETAGTWHEMAIEHTQEIGRRITTITEDIRETTFFFQRLFMALQRGNAVSFHNTMVTE